MRRLAVLLAALLALTACGTTEPAGDGGAPSAPAGPPITVSDAAGRQVSLPGPPQRVVALEWNVAEHAVSLGVMPVGVSDVEGYSDWVGVEPLDGTVRDVGERGEPSPDAIAALAPDLILVTSRDSGNDLSQLERFAPVVLVEANDPADPVGQMRRNVTLVGQALGRDAEAAADLAAFDAVVADGRARLAGVAGEPFLFTDATATGGQVAVRAFTDQSLIGALTTRLGLVNAWTEPPSGSYGLAQTDVEGLTRAGNPRFLYILNDDSGGDVFADELAGNAVWRSLPFVAQGRVDRLPDGIWVFGGTTSASRYVEALVAALAPGP